MGFLDKMIKQSRLKSPWIVHFDFCSKTYRPINIFSLCKEILQII